MTTTTKTKRKTHQEYASRETLASRTAKRARLLIYRVPLSRKPRL